MRRYVLPTILLVASAGVAAAQTRIIAPRAGAGGVLALSADPNRAMLGISMSSDGKRDTLGVLVTAVTEGGPAEKAGIEEGNRIASINGVNMKLSRADAGEEDMSGVMPNRLSREMRKLKPGDEATLEVWAGGRTRTVKVKTVSAEELTPRRVMARERAGTDEERAALGLYVSTTGKLRDTLGVFVSSVAEDGPAEKAGIMEGDRIASIGGVDLKTPKEDIGEGWATSSRANRLSREVAKLKPGQSVDLVVMSGGRSRTVKVTAARAKDVKGGDGFSFRYGDAPDPVILRDRIRGTLRGISPSIRMNLEETLPRAFEHLRWSLDDELSPAMDGVRWNLDRELPRAMEELRWKFDGDAPIVKKKVLKTVI